jgi:nucleoside permease NupC
VSAAAGDLSRLGIRAMIGGLLATCLVACVAGVFL